MSTHSTAGSAPGEVSGTVVGRYRLLDVVGSGGMGKVWRAHDELLDREVAVKEIEPPAGMSAQDHRDVQLRAVREARAAARLDHPGVVRVFDVVRMTGRSFIVMEYVPSRSLHELVTSDGPLSHREAARIGLGVLGALRAAHAAGVVHSDVKPHNVLVADDGRVVLTDFGLATFARSRRAAGSVTEVGPVLGSPYYVAPERLNDGASSVRGDLWSLGATLYTAVEGRSPFARATVTGSLLALTTEPPDPARRPGPLHPLITALLAKEPSRRPAAGQVHATLAGLTSRAVGVSVVPAPRRPAGGAGHSRPTGVTPLPSPPAPTPPPMPTPPILVPPTAGSPAAHRPSRRVRVALAVLLAGLAGTVAATARDGGYPSAATRVGTAVRAAATGPCGAAPAQPLDAGAGERGPYALPDGWLWHRDPAGFRLAVPRGWNRATAGTTVCFRDPDGTRTFGVDTAAPVTRLPLEHWQNAERAAVTGGTLPGYQPISMGVLLVQSGGADWEYTWAPPAEPRQHVRRILLSVTADRAYRLWWATRDHDRALNLADGQRLVSSLA